MGILEKYQIVTALGAGETNSFRAQEVLTGRPVVVHQFLRDQTSPDQPDLMSMVYNYLSRADAPGIENYLDSGEDGDTVYIVTSDVPECLDLRQWLQTMAIALGDGGTSAAISAAEPESAHAPAASSPDPLQQSPPETNHEPGEFTSMFNAPVTQAAAPPSPELNAEPAAKPADKVPGGQVPSGFEVVYRSRKRTTDPGLAPEQFTPTIAAPMQAPTPAAGPGEFTGQFLGLSEGKAEPPPTQTPPIPVGTPLKPAPPDDNSFTGEFTQMFSGVGKGRTGQPQPTPPPTAKPPSAASHGEESGPGQFTQMFKGVGAGDPKQPSAPPPSARASNTPSPKQAADKSGPGEFTQMFTAPRATPGQPASAPSSLGAAKPSAPPDSPTQKGPGQFTMAFRLGAQGPAKADPPLTAPSPAPTTPPTGSASQGTIQQKPASVAPKSDSQPPGDFTQMFKSGSEPPRSPGLGSPSRPPASSSSKKGPGEFTMLMQGHKPTTGTPAPPQVLETPKPATPSPAADPKKKGPGEFTMMFRPPSAPAAPVPQAGPPPPVAPQTPPPPRAQKAGEYTSIFEAPRMPPAAPQPAPQGAPPPGYGYPAAPVAPPPPQMPVYQPPPPMAPQVAYPQVPQYQPPQPPSYTMAPPPAPQMQVAAMPPPPQPQTMPPTGTSKPAIFWILLLALGCLFLTAVVLVLFFALKH